MAVRKPVPKSKAAPKPPNTAAFLLAEDRVRRARAAQQPVDLSGEHHESLRELAEQTGRDVSALVEEFMARAAAREYDGGIPRQMAERLACQDVIEAYTRQRTIAV